MTLANEHTLKFGKKSRKLNIVRDENHAKGNKNRLR